MKVINVALAEDHGALRQGYVTLLRSQKNIHVLFDVANGKELLEKLKISRPHILLLDLNMPMMKGQEVLEIISAKYPTLKVIVVSGYFQPENIVECFKLGIKAFLPKEYKIEKIVEAIVTTFNKGGYIDNEVGLILANELRHSERADKIELTEHQVEVLKLICKGYTNKKAAEVLKVSISGIKYHRANIMDRTNCKTLQDLVAFALINKYIDAK